MDLKALTLITALLFLSTIAFNPHLASAASAISVTLSASPNHASAGQAISILASWSGGAPQYSATLYYGSSNSCSGSSSSGSGFTTTSQTYSVAQISSGEYFCEIITDSQGHLAQAGPIYVPTSSATTLTSSTTAFTTSTTVPTTSIFASSTTIIQSSSLSVSLGASPNPAALGQTVTITASWSGGTPPYTATLYSNPSPSCSGTSSSGSGFTTTSETYYETQSSSGEYFCEIITDSQGHSGQGGPIYISTSGATTSTAFTSSTTVPTTSILASSTTTIQSSSLSVSLGASPNPAQTGQTIRINASWSGGTPPYTATLYTSSSPICGGSSSSSSGYSGTSTTYYATQTSSGLYFCEIITDSQGHSGQGGPIYVSAGTTTTSTNTTTTVPTTTIGICPYATNPLLAWLCYITVTSSTSTFYTSTSSTYFTTTINNSINTTTTSLCANGATNPPNCNNLCANGATNPPFCDNICANGATNPPYCGYSPSGANPKLASSAPTLTIQYPTVAYSQQDTITATTGTTDQLQITIQAISSASQPIIITNTAPSGPGGSFDVVVCGIDTYPAPPTLNEAFECLGSGTYTVTATDLSTGLSSSATLTIQAAPVAEQCPNPPPTPGSPGSAISSPAAYDQQYLLEYTKSVSSLDYIVTATVQPQDSSGTGPVYLLNGLGTTGCWYQLGLSYNWGGTGYHDQFVALVAVLNQNSNFLNEQYFNFPFHAAGNPNATGVVNPGDQIEIHLWIPSPNPNNLVKMTERDINTGAYFSYTYSAYGATAFTSTTSGEFFTGPMTEQYFNAPFNGSIASVPELYIDNSTPISSIPSKLLMDEYCTTQTTNCGIQYMYESNGAITPPSTGSICANQNGNPCTSAPPLPFGYTLTGQTVLVGETFSPNGDFVTDEYLPPTVNLRIDTNPVDQGALDIIGASARSATGDILGWLPVQISIDGTTVTTGSSSKVYVMCPSPTYPNCLQPGSYNVQAAITGTSAQSGITSTPQTLVVNPSGLACALYSSPVSALISTGSTGSIECDCPNAILVSPGAPCPTSQVCPPGAQFLPNGSSGMNCECPVNQFVASGTSSCLAPTPPNTCSSGYELPDGSCGCVNGIPNAQGSCTFCPSGTAASFDSSTGQYSCANAGTSTTTSASTTVTIGNGGGGGIPPINIPQPVCGDGDCSNYCGGGIGGYSDWLVQCVFS